MVLASWFSITLSGVARGGTGRRGKDEDERLLPNEILFLDTEVYMRHKTEIPSSPIVGAGVVRNANSLCDKARDGLS